MDKDIKRVIYIEKIDAAFRMVPVVAILGPRQTGKTTLVKMYFVRERGQDEGR
ncbi:MAG: hypothetical protein K0Q74_1335 [Gammaproteobacteria bacterium]|jgi:predicted AAA+ superfamily ATPase|nr:hypothetical protein [Gammaproteobacteria bacterium]